MKNQTITKPGNLITIPDVLPEFQNVISFQCVNGFYCGFPFTYRHTPECPQCGKPGKQIG